MSEWTNIIAAKDFPQEGPYTLVLKGHSIALYFLDGNYYAIEDCCTHQGLPLSEGPLKNDIITCPYHGAQFCIKTGEVKASPAFDNLPIFEVRILDDMIQIQI